MEEGSRGMTYKELDLNTKIKLKDYEDTEKAPDEIELLKYHHDEQIRNENLKMTLKKKIKEIKGSSDYPHNFKGQMVEDFEWVLGLLK